MSSSATRLRGAFPGDPLPEHDPIGHLELVGNADAYLVAPASANTIAKLAAGIADSMLTTSFLACAAPRLVAPAMNDRMYRDAATQANLATLRERGRQRDRARRGRARLPRRARRRPAARARELLLAAIEAGGAAGRGPWDGLRVLVTPAARASRSTRCASSATAPAAAWASRSPSAAARRGAEVTLVAANVALPAPPGVRRVDVETAAELAGGAASASSTPATCC